MSSNKLREGTKINLKQVAWCVLLVGVLLTGLFVSRYPGGQSSLPLSRPTDSKPSSSSTRLEETPAADVLRRYAELLTSGQVEEAARLLGPKLRSMAEYDNYAGLRNTPKMEILKLVDHTDDWPPDFGGLLPRPNEWVVFYMEARYRVLGIAPSFLADGEVNYHKITVARVPGTDEWLITEEAATRARE